MCIMCTVCGCIVETTNSVYSSEAEAATTGLRDYGTTKGEGGEEEID